MEREFKKIEIDSELSRYFNKRFNGEIDEIDIISAFKDKKSINRSNLIQKLNLDPKRKT